MLTPHSSLCSITHRKNNLPSHQPILIHTPSLMYTPMYSQVTDFSSVKIMVEDRKLAVYVDPRNRGEWEECVTIEDMPLPEGWAREAHVGLTASTGQLVDNHDIISLVTYADHAVMEREEAKKYSQSLFEIAPKNMYV